MTTTPTPRRTVRRADRYKQESGVSPSTALMVRTGEAGISDASSPAPQPTPAAAYRRRSQTAGAPAPLAATPGTDPSLQPPPPPPRRTPQPPPPMDRPPNAPQQKKRPPRQRAPRRMPVWLTAALITLFFLAAGLFTAQSLMDAYLVQRAQEWADAHQRVVDAHPIYYKDLIEQYAAENNLKPAFVTAVILNESSFRTDAESSVGARGLMQLMPNTAEWIAGKLGISGYSFDRMYDAETNIRFGTWYLGYLSRLFRGDPVSVAAAYHAGQGQVSGWLSDPGISKDGVTIDLESLSDGPTKTYARRVTQAYGIYEALYYSQAGSHADDGMPSGLDAARR